MREILFKAKRVDNGEWVVGSYVYTFNEDKACPVIGVMKENHWIVEKNGNIVSVDKDTICQYTGLTDKNGNKIWENDIVKCNYNDYGEKGTYIGKVIFREDTCTFIVTDRKSTDYEWWNEEKELIGNIFDHPDLLKGE